MGGGTTTLKWLWWNDEYARCDVSFARVPKLGIAFLTRGSTPNFCGVLKLVSLHSTRLPSFGVLDAWGTEGDLAAVFLFLSFRRTEVSPQA